MYETPTVLCRFLLNFASDLVVVWRFAYCLDIILRLFCHFFSQNKLSSLSGQSEKIRGILCIQPLRQFYVDSFETLQALRPSSEDVHIVWIQNELSLVNGYWESCVFNSF